MSIALGRNSYGKSKVRLTRVLRAGACHDFIDWNVDIRLVGAFEDTHLTGDNSAVVATDTMKNTVYALAGGMAGEDGGTSDRLEDPEHFAERLARHFVERNEQVSQASVAILQRNWQRIQLDGQPHEHAWVQGGSGERTSGLVARRTTDGEVDVQVSAGCAGLVLLKTAGSGFVGFVRDEFTTLPEVTDRIFSTAVDAWWEYDEAPDDRAATWSSVREALMAEFAVHDSLSVQQTGFAMGERVLREHPDISRIDLSLPNRHCLRVDMDKLGLEDRNEVFVTTDEPHGQIDISVERT